VIPVRVNGEDRSVPDGTTLLGAVTAVADLAGGARGTAVVVNAEVVPRGEWATRVLVPGDRVEVLRAAQGGC
jgi:sulfur carrier protein